MENLNKVIQLLKNGGVVAHATDTCYGFACDVLNKKAVEHLYELKKMPLSKPVSILVSDIEMAKKYGEFNEKALELAEKFWPGALTIIVKRKSQLPNFINPNSETVGFRLPSDRLSIELVRGLGHPITTTSANVSGEPSTYSIAEINVRFANEKLRPDFIIDSGELDRKNPPSTVVDASKGELSVLRQGNIVI